MWINVCVRGWVAKEGIRSSAFLTGSFRVSRGALLSILLRRQHKERCLRKPARPEVKDNASSRRRAGQSALRCGSRAVKGRYGVKKGDSELWRR